MCHIFFIHSSVNGHLCFFHVLAIVSSAAMNIELSVVRWMDLEFVIQSEVIQKEKNKYHMLTHIYGI